MDTGGAKGKAKSDINVTPLIDIVLVLLIVFIVMVPGLTKASKVVVPQEMIVINPPPPDPKNLPVVISIDKDGKYYLQQDFIELKDLPDKLIPVVKNQPINNRKVILKVDEDLAFQYVVNALDQIRFASDRAKKETLADPTFQGLDGGDIKVPISIKKRT